MPLVSVKIAPPSGTIILSSPQRRNALDLAMLDDLSQALSDLHQTKKVRAVILAGAGADFCAGADLQSLNDIQQRDAHESMPQWFEYWNRVREILEQMLRYPKPLVAAVDGAAMGTGFSLVLACDLVVASSGARFGTPAVLRGLISGTVGPLLSWRIGGSAASRFLLTGESVAAADAKQIGLVHEVVPAEQVWAEAQRLCEQCARAPAEALQLTKRLLNENIAESVLGHLSVGAAMNATACTTEAAAEGITAFLNKREPRWP